MDTFAEFFLPFFNTVHLGIPYAYTHLGENNLKCSIE